MSQTSRETYTAFCETRPSPESVFQVLSTWHYTLLWSRPAEIGGAPYLASLPAQYHFEGPSGETVVYFDGTDRPIFAEMPTPYPSHQSRFWIGSGGVPDRFDQLFFDLGDQFALRWQDDIRLIYPDDLDLVEERRAS